MDKLTLILFQKSKSENFSLTLVGHELGPTLIEMYQKHAKLMEQSYSTFLLCERDQPRLGPVFGC